MIYQCPYPGFGHLAEVITNYHCQTSHKMSREKLIKKYGKPIEMKLDRKKLQDNLSVYRVVKLT